MPEVAHLYRQTLRAKFRPMILRRYEALQKSAMSKATARLPRLSIGEPSQRKYASLSCPAEL